LAIDWVRADPDLMPNILKALGSCFGQRRRPLAAVPCTAEPAAASSVAGYGRFVQDPAVTAKILGDQLVLVQLRTGATFRLNQTGQLIWELVCAGKSRAEIVQGLTVAFPAATDRLPEDTDRLLLELLQSQLLQPVGEGQS
jgi:hypothetical protein